MSKTLKKIRNFLLVTFGVAAAGWAALILVVVMAFNAN